MLSFDRIRSICESTSILSRPTIEFRWRGRRHQAAPDKASCERSYPALTCNEGLGVGFAATCRGFARPVVAKVQPCCLPDP